MNDLIRRQTIKDGMIKYGFHAPDMTVTEFVEDVLDPVREVKRGRWIHRDVYKRFKDEWQTAKCSECGLYHTTPYMYSFDVFPYCPNCGSRMTEDTNET